MPIIGAFILPHPPIILPEVGHGEEKHLQKTTDAFIKVAQWIGDLAPETIVLTSPHSVMYADYLHISPGAGASGDMRRFRAPGVAVRAEYDREFVTRWKNGRRTPPYRPGLWASGTPRLTTGRSYPLKFINDRYADYRLVRTGLSRLSMTEHYRFGQCIRDVSDALGRRVVLIASGDLSHKLKADGPYGFAEEGVRFDREITQAMAEGDFMKFLSFGPEFAEKAAECGLRSCVILAGRSMASASNRSSCHTRGRSVSATASRRLSRRVKIPAGGF
jgi:aromatic ring-opening dioxygenase LigB subunit